MLDRAIFSGSVHCLKDEQYRPLILPVKHVLQFSKYFNTAFQQFFCPRFVFGSGLTGIVRIDILEPKLLAIGDAVRRYEFLGPFDDFFLFHFVYRELGSRATSSTFIGIAPDVSFLQQQDRSYPRGSEWC